MNYPSNYPAQPRRPVGAYASIEERIGQVVSLLAIRTEPLTTHKIAREIGISPRRVSQICKVMFDREIIHVEEYPDHRMAKGFKWLISRRQP